MTINVTQNGVFYFQPVENAQKECSFWTKWVKNME
jgi:hypothetical protein